MKGHFTHGVFRFIMEGSCKVVGSSKAASETFLMRMDTIQTFSRKKVERCDKAIQTTKTKSRYMSAIHLATVHVNRP